MGGHTHRERHVLEAAVGEGTCPDEKSEQRFDERTCNEKFCFKKNKAEPLKCYSKVDVLLLLDGSGSVTEEGFATTKTFAKKFVSSFEGNNASMSVMVFSGPKTWWKYWKCSKNQTRKGLSDVEMKNDCGINLAQHFTTDMAATKGVIDGLTFPRGTTFTSMALATAMAEVSNSRNEVPTFVVIVTDGQPLSSERTLKAAKALKEKGVRMIVVPVSGMGLTPAGIDLMREMASEPKGDNFLKVDFSTLNGMPTYDTLILDMCPKCGPFVK